MTNEWKIDDVLGVWPLHGLCGLWGGIACGIFGLKAFGGLGGVTFGAQLVGSVMGAAAGYVSGWIVYRVVDALMGLRMSAGRRAARRRPRDPQDRRQSRERYDVADRLKRVMASDPPRAS